MNPFLFITEHAPHLSIVLAVVTALWPVIKDALRIVLRFAFGRRRTPAEREEVAVERERASDMRRRQMLDEEMGAMFDRLKAEIVANQARIRELERDRDRGWDLARAWHTAAHALCHKLRNLVMATAPYLPPGMAPIEVPRLPPLEEIAL